jgi:hypothetical protein
VRIALRTLLPAAVGVDHEYYGSGQEVSGRQRKGSLRSSGWRGLPWPATRARSRPTISSRWVMGLPAGIAGTHTVQKDI